MPKLWHYRMLIWLLARKFPANDAPGRLPFRGKFVAVARRTEVFQVLIETLFEECLLMNMTEAHRRC